MTATPIRLLAIRHTDQMPAPEALGARQLSAVTLTVLIAGAILGLPIPGTDKKDKHGGLMECQRNSVGIFTCSR